MAQMDLIDLTSSDSYSGSFQSHQLPKRASSSAGRLTDYNHLSVVDHKKHSSSIYRATTPKQHMSLADAPKLSKFQTYGYGKVSPQHTLKRSLPPSFHPSTPTVKPSASMRNRGNFKSSDTHYNTYTNIIDDKVHTTNNFGRTNNDEVLMYEHSGSRLLPPSLVHGKLLPSPQSASSSNSGYDRGGTEGPTDDERLIYQAALQNLSQPKLEATLPDGLLAVPLMRHQKETTGMQCLGGILADDQGLGKTISMIVLILLQKHLQPAAGTLVVCPASVLRQWARELDDKVTDSAKLSILIYHGGTRTKDPFELAKHDVVLTTIPSKGLDSSSIDCGGGTLAKVGWFRVILDEAQTIKNHKTQVARACCGLRAKRRWCLSGTPIQNTIDDLFSYFRFLKYDPYSSYKYFHSSIKDPIINDSAHGYKKLQAVLKTILLRRTKGTLLDGEPIINLPPKSICLMKVDFFIEERTFYSKLEEHSRSQFEAYAAAGTLNKNYSHILLMLLRLRQACDHPLLVRRHTSDFVGKASVEMAKRLPRDMLMNLLSVLEDPICSLCGLDYLTGDDNICPAHECKEQLGTDVVFAKATLRHCISDDIHDDTTSSSEGADKSLVLQNMYTSSKIRAALEILEKHCKLKKNCNKRSALEEYNGNLCSSEAKYLECSDSDVCVATNSSQVERSVKAIVFSQWIGMLDLVETSLKSTCIQYRRFDGTMSLALREKAVKDFNNDPEVTVMLMSLKAGNLGLNMVAACHVILLDLWWNPTTEDQAVDRAHRIGQTRPVTVSRLTITDSVEDRILALQEKKREMVASAFGEDQMGGSSTRLTVEDLRYLFKA
ncbi:hypothetical protein AQUCO_03500045v1 [Aquilegia coerulea]|uniref:Helicase ATP-binding domain-containing protein n=1 Tax=Aquilegia coerulea TaxID=218851 RepID=A0A2G5CVV7_AQUCA|nr:hypothetical protein AQUCO_03500045v1 [Aquilegia coerulea]